jgi:hypothetical protein
MPTDPARNVTGNSDNFTSFMRRLVAVPYLEIKSKVDAEREANAKINFPRPCRPNQASLDRRFSHRAGQFCVSQSLR